MSAPKDKTDGNEKAKVAKVAKGDVRSDRFVVDIEDLTIIQPGGELPARREIPAQA